jgi:hypothetical protein
MRDEEPQRGSLSSAAITFRAAHTGFAVVQLASLGYVWSCALSGRRNRPLGAAVGLLGLEGAALIVGRGNCPLGPFQERLGDPVPLFELVLPPRAAKAAVPILAAVAVAGVVALAILPHDERTAASILRHRRQPVVV